MKALRCLYLIICISTVLKAGELPARFDLRSTETGNYVSSVKSQEGGTCWAHAVMASMESNLLRSGNWQANRSDSEPDLSEYHLDWWNGFNTFFNRDFGFNTEQGLEVHYGGDYRLAAAYLSRGDGAVQDLGPQSFDTAPAYRDSTYRYFYPRRIFWLSLNDDMSNMSILKQQIMEQGAVGTCMYVGTDFPIDTTKGSFFQPPSDPNEPNHAIAIVGWDDSLRTPADLPGAWLCKNSWGPSWGAEWEGEGYFWISYYDKHAARHPEMGFVAFREVEELRYDTLYYHDYHGWRDQIDVREAANAFLAGGRDSIKAVSFYTLADSVYADIGICTSRAKLQKGEYVRRQTAFLKYRGFHTLELEDPWLSIPGDSFFVSLHLDRGAQAIDRSSYVPVLLRQPQIYKAALQGAFVPSRASAGESLYLDQGEWKDLQSFDKSANFCIKALAKHAKPSISPTDSEQPYLLGLYPNPISGQGRLEINIPAAGFLRIELRDIQGKIVRVLAEGNFKAGSQNFYIDVSDLSQGLYLCNLRYDNSRSETLKIIVLR